MYRGFFDRYLRNVRGRLQNDAGLVRAESPDLARVRRRSYSGLGRTNVISALSARLETISEEKTRRRGFLGLVRSLLTTLAQSDLSDRQPVHSAHTEALVVRIDSLLQIFSLYCLGLHAIG